MSLKALDSHVVSKIRSSFNIKSLPQCVTELVLNSLDAQSTAIAVRINLATFKIQVVDNGIGISRENLEKIGQRYMTNKCRTLHDLQKDLKTYGFRGEAIASICKISKRVKITTREQDSDETYQKIIEGIGGEVDLVNSRPSCGTTISIEGFLNNLPVRQRCVNKSIEIENVKSSLQSLIIINPGVSITLRDDYHSNKIVLSSRVRSNIAEALKDAHEEIDENRFTFIKVAKKFIRIEGLLCKDLHNNRRLQYVYVNQRPVNCIQISNLVCDLFAKSVKSDDKKKKHPIFVVNVKCPPADVDLQLEPAKTLVLFKNFENIAKCIKKLVGNFLGPDSRPKITKTWIKQKSEFGVSRIFGAVKGVAKKRKVAEIVEDNKSSKSDDVIVEPPRKLPKDDEVLTVTTNFPENEESGRAFIMDLFLRSIQVYSNNVDDKPRDKNLSNLSLVVQKSTQYSRFPKFNLNLDPDEDMQSIYDNNLSMWNSSKSNSPPIFATKVPTNKNPTEKVSVGVQTGNESLFPDFLRPPEIPRRSLRKFVSDYDYDYSNFNRIPEIPRRRFLENDEKPKKLFDCNRSSELAFCYNDNANFTIMPINEVTTLMNTRLSPIERNDLFRKPISSFEVKNDGNFFDFHRETKEIFNGNETISKYFAKVEKPLSFFQFGTNFMFENDFFPKIAKIDPPDDPDSKLFKKPLSVFKNYAKNIQITPRETQTFKPNETVSRFFNDSANKSDALNISEIISKLDEDNLEIIETESSENPQNYSNLIVSIEEFEDKEIMKNDLIFENDLNKNLMTANTSKSLVIPTQVISERINWIKNHNEFGAAIYYNTETGLSSIYSPKKTNFTFGLSKRLECVPKGMSPILKEVKVEAISPQSKEILQNAIVESYNDDLILVKWRNCIGEKDPNLFFTDIYEEKSKLIENPIPDLSKKAFPFAVGKNLEGSTFTKDLFENLDVIGQVDCKFIAVINKCNNLLILFDQHAVHERVRLESLLEVYDGKSANIDDTTITMFLQDEDLEILRSHDDNLKNLGLKYDFFSNGINIFKVPFCLFKKSKKGFNLASLIQTLIREVLDSLRENNGILVKYPHIIQNVINSEACRSAIKFGDELSRKECCKHLEDLSKCALPFQCAHGRPTLTPLISLQKGIPDFDLPAKPNLRKLEVKK